MPQTASARLATDAQNAGVALLPCFVEELTPVIDSANNYNKTEQHTPYLLRTKASLDTHTIQTLESAQAVSHIPPLPGGGVYG